MCFVVVERYSVCRCLYYKHSVDMCDQYHEKDHAIKERTVLVGYPCDEHGKDQDASDGGGSGLSLPADKGFSEGEAPLSQTGPDLGELRQNGPSRSVQEAVGKSPENDADDALDNPNILRGAQLGHIILPPASVQATFITDGSTHLQSLRSRLLGSEAYFASLAKLECNIWENSSLCARNLQNLHCLNGTFLNEKSKFVTYPEISLHLLDQAVELPKPVSDEVVTALCQNHIYNRCEALNMLRECRNIAMRTYLNLRRLQLAGFCGTEFSVIIADDKRQNVARLMAVSVSQIAELLRALELWLQDSVKKIHEKQYDATQRSLWDVRSNINFVVRKANLNFEDFLSTFAPFRNLSAGQTPNNSVRIGVVSQFVCFLDIGVVSYAGAHLNDLRCETYYRKYFGTQIDIEPPSTLYEDRQPFISVKRGSLQCLNEFHGGRTVWVFRNEQLSSRNTSNNFYLSTTMSTFADIWGPLWKGIDQKNRSKYAAYIVGNGSILPWKHDQLRDPPLEKETFCHWVSDETWDGGLNTLFSSNIDHNIAFEGSEQLLIGAPTLGATIMDVNVKCQLSISKAWQFLRNQGRLCILGATGPYNYIDGSQYQLQIGYSGVNTSATKQYKRNSGQTLKQVLVELWSMEPAFRGPRILADLHGVEVSICTHNARRVSLAHLLCISSMRSLLSGFNWENEEFKTEYFETLTDCSRELRQSNTAFREQFEQAVLLCLKMLSKTGVSQKGDNFSVFLSSPCTPKPELATLVSAEHSWTGLLKDTTTECAMAAFGDQCLEFNHTVGARCGGIGKSALLTALVPNRLAECPLLVMEATEGISESGERVETWSFENLEVGECFWLGDIGILRFKGKLTTGILVMEWQSPGLRTAMKMLVGKEYPHREYTEVDQSGDESLKPIPVIVVSKSASGGRKQSRSFVILRGPGKEDAKEENK